MTSHGFQVCDPINTPVALATEYTPAFSFTVKAIKVNNGANGAVIYIGGTGVTAANGGFPLTAGQTLEFPPESTNPYDLHSIFITGSNADDGVVFIYHQR